LKVTTTYYPCQPGIVLVQECIKERYAILSKFQATGYGP